MAICRLRLRMRGTVSFFPDTTRRVVSTMVAHSVLFVRTVPDRQVNFHTAIWTAHKRKAPESTPGPGLDKGVRPLGITRLLIRLRGGRGSDPPVYRLPAQIEPLIQSCNCFFCVRAPTRSATFLPPLKIIIVGMAWMAYCCVTAGF